MVEPLLIAQDGATPLYLLPAMANRHGLVAGATGTGKTVTLQVMAEAFSRIGVPAEKHPENYRLLIAQAGLDPARTYMIGNSPRSDINPALKAGLRAVFIPHPHTWELEHEDIDHTDERVTTITAFPQLREVF